MPGENMPMVPDKGAHLPIGHYPAIRDSFIFDPKTNAWSEAGEMIPERGRGDLGGGRWYPSLLTLNSGRVSAFWGHPADTDTRHTNDTPEIFSPETLRWEFLGTEDDVNAFGVISIGYPRVHLLPNGRIFRASPVPDGDSTKNVAINPIPQTLTDPNKISVKVSSGPGEGYNVTGDTSSSSVLLPLTPADKYRAQVLLVGGGLKQVKGNNSIVVVQPQLIDIGTNTTTIFPPKWGETKPRDVGISDRARVHANATILPTGEIFVSGGQSTMGFVLEGEIYNPFKTPRGPRGSAAGGTWRTVATAKVGRQYHSVALLMPDGRIWHAGTGSKIAGVEESVDIYEPWYYTETRPVIRCMTGPQDPIYRGDPGSDDHGVVMHPHDSGLTEVVVDHFRDVKKFALVRAGSATHAFNSDQRYIELQVGLVNNNDKCKTPVSGPRFTFRLTSPPSSSIAPPGNYLLFAIDDLGVPSVVGRFIRIDRQFVGELKQEAEGFTSGQGNVSVSGTDATALVMQWDSVTGDPVVEYGGIDFGTQTGVVKQFSALQGSPVGGQFNVRLDKPDGPHIAFLDLPSGGSGVEQATSVTPVSGVHDVFIRFTPNIFQQNSFTIVDWFKFKVEALPPAAQLKFFEFIQPGHTAKNVAPFAAPPETWARRPGLTGFFFDFDPEGRGDNHLEEIGVQLEQNGGQVTYRDKDPLDSRRDLFQFSVAGRDLPKGTNYRSAGVITSSGGGKSTVNIQDEPGVVILTGFRFKYTNGDHHMDRMLIKFEAGPPPRFMVEFNDKNGDDPFAYEIRYALVPASAVANQGTIGTSNARGVARVAAPAGERLYIQGFLLDYVSTFTSGEDHHVDEIGVKFEDKANGALSVWYNDKNNDDGFNWAVDFVQLN